MSIGNRNYIKMLFSVIIPTYKDGNSLFFVKCLESLSKQTLGVENYEVIICDNNEILGEYKNLGGNFKVIHEPSPGSYSARNAGLNIAKGKYIAFTDSDCYVSDDWLEKGREILDSGADRIAGNIILYNADGSEGSVFSRAYEKAFSFNQKGNAENGSSVTANLFARRELFDLVGYFNDELFSGGDFEWNKRATDKGLSIVYSSEVIAFHPIRDSFKKLILKRKRAMGGVYSQFSFKNMMRLLVPPLKTAMHIYRRDDLTFFEKIGAISVYYFLNVYSFYCILLFKYGLSTPPRS